MCSVQVFWQFCKNFYSLTCFKKQYLFFFKLTPSYGWNIANTAKTTIKNFPLDRMLNGALYQGLALNRLFLLRFSKSMSARKISKRSTGFNGYQRLYDYLLSEGLVFAYLQAYHRIRNKRSMGHIAQLRNSSNQYIKIIPSLWSREKTLKSIKMIKFNFLCLFVIDISWINNNLCLKFAWNLTCSSG